MEPGYSQRRSQELNEFRQRIRWIAGRVFRLKIRRGRALIVEAADDRSFFAIRPISRRAAPVVVRTDSLHQVSLFTGDRAFPCILADRDPRELAGLVRRNLVAIRRGQCRESRLGDGISDAAVVEIGRGIERTFVSYNTLRARIKQTPPDWIRFRYQSY